MESICVALATLVGFVAMLLFVAYSVLGMHAITLVQQVLATLNF
jgi:hypothetical protein